LGGLFSGLSEIGGCCRARNGDFFKEKMLLSLASCWVTVVVEAYVVLFKHHELIAINMMMLHCIGSHQSPPFDDAYIKLESCFVVDLLRVSEPYLMILV
jgi:hypothetical protein